MRRAATLLTLVLALLLPQVVLAEEHDKVGAPPSISAAAALLMDGNTGQVLWQFNAKEERAIASTTKILTAILVIEHSQMSDTVVVSKKASQMGGSGTPLSEGEGRSVEELLYAMMLESGNNAAVALAEHISGSQEKFAELMNRKAKTLGAKNSKFSNAHGLLNADHYSTAGDLAIIAQYAMRNPAFRKLVAAEEKVIERPGKSDWNLEASNELLAKYDPATGIKTGYTRKAGQCLVSSARKGEREVIAVLLGGRSEDQVYEDSIELLEYGFSGFSYRNLVEEGKPVGSFRKDGTVFQLEAGGDLRLLMSKEEKARTVVVPNQSLRAPEKGKRVGSVLAVQGDRAVSKVPLVVGPGKADPDAQGQGFLTRIGLWLRDILPF